MKRMTLFGLLLVTMFCCFGRAARSSAWKDSDYKKFTPKKFSRYPPARRRIDFKKIDYPLLSAAIFYETNRRRTQHNKTPFIYAPELRKAAFGHCKDMVEKNFYSHRNPVDPKKETLRKRMALVGISECPTSENIALETAREGKTVLVPSRSRGTRRGRTQPKLKLSRPFTYLEFAKELLDGWMGSPGHRANILSGKIYLGAAAYHYLRKIQSSEGEDYWIDYFKCCQNFAGKFISGHPVQVVQRELEVAEQKQDIEELARKLSSPYIYFGIRARRALVKIGRPAVPALTRVLKGEKQIGRSNAAIALGEIGDKTAMPALRRALDDKSEEVRKAAGGALEKLESTR